MKAKNIYKCYTARISSVDGSQRTREIGLNRREKVHGVNGVCLRHDQASLST